MIIYDYDNVGCGTSNCYYGLLWLQDGRLPAEYQKSRDSDELLQILHDARTLNAYGKVRFAVIKTYNII